MLNGNNRPSRPLDVHRWSNHPESNVFVNRIYSEWFEGYSQAITKKHLKVILLDFYVAWKTHPEMMIGIAMSNSFYKANCRYNALYISSKTIGVLKRLLEAGLVDWEKGYPGFDVFKGKLSQFWATDELIEEFKRVRFGLHAFILNKADAFYWNWLPLNRFGPCAIVHVGEGVLGIDTIFTG